MVLHYPLKLQLAAGVTTENVTHPNEQLITCFSILPAHILFVQILNFFHIFFNGSLYCFLNFTSFMQKLFQDIDYIIWTGDLPPHDVWNQTREENLYVLKETVAQMAQLFPGIPIFPALGNHEAAPVNRFVTPPFDMAEGEGASHASHATKFFCPVFLLHLCRMTIQLTGFMMNWIHNGDSGFPPAFPVQ